MFTERSTTTSLRSPRRGPRRLAGAVVAAGIAITTLAAGPVAPAGAQTTGAESTVDDAALQVAQRRAAEHRRQSEIAKQRVAALAAFLAAQRTAPVIEKGATAIGRPYSRGAAGPNAFDCSGFTRWAWEAAGVELPHYSGAQWDQSEHIAIEDLQPGDLVFYWGRGESGDPSHVGLYVGDGQMIHAPGSGRSVRYESIWYWSGARVAAGRVS